jgi:threonyl-tRNA synthetase
MPDSSQLLSLELPDGSIQEVAPGTTPLEVAAGIGPGLARAAIGAELDGRAIDLAVKRLWPEVEIDVGRVDHSEKFQYDFRFHRAFTPEDLEAIEAKMRQILKEDHLFERRELEREEAAELFAGMGETLKVERLGDIPEGEPISIFRDGEFTDLCRGPHVQRLSQIGAVKLLEASGVYWKGDESNEMLQRIYGTAFATADEMKAYEEQLEAAQARDHRRLGPELDLFSFDPLAPAMPFFHPKGAFIYNTLVDYVRELQNDRGYGEVVTPQVLDVDLWHASGHYDHYRDAMFFTEAEDRSMAVKPMNCPTHCLIYKTRLRSYRDLPIRYGDFGRLHRYEKSGVTSGLTRVRSFAQDDAHVFCTPEQIEQEVLAAVEMIREIYDTFGFDDQLELSTRPEKRLGSDELWDKAEATLEAALKSTGLDYDVNEGDGAFYGPKIDFQIRDAIGRSWQLGTVQLDFQMPERFGLEYIGADGAEHQPVMIHRAMLGSIERFVGILIEHTTGAFPLWLAPVQAVVLPVSEKFGRYAAEARHRLAAAGVRADLDERNEKLGYRIREAQLAKIPYMLVVGAKEEEAGTVAVRLRTGEDRGPQPTGEVAQRIAELTSLRSLEL